MDAEDNNMNQGVDMVNEARELVNSLIHFIGTDNLQEQELEVELEVANQKLEDTREHLIVLRDDYFNVIAQAMQEAQVRQPNPNPNPPQQPQEPPVGMNLAIGNPWRPIVEHQKSYMANPTCHEDHLKGFLNTREQKVGNGDLFRVYSEETQTGPAHFPVFSITVGVTSELLVNRNEQNFEGQGTGNTKKVAERAALFNLFEQERSEEFLQFYEEAKLTALVRRG
ncbi:predicted protein [Chaetoceros tenuissimus]|uniref:DRBM domain-containing protein n=1 Tax=Chaetoceros tenuissimus TaxID=426638 RepID=A0AAD3D5G9_9STRA|nr:predicted protein [Chaetoceros tenuissimus]